jgi:hypothetical protein
VRLDIKKAAKKLTLRGGSTGFSPGRNLGQAHQLEPG